MRNKFFIIVVLFLALIFIFDYSYTQEPEKPPKKRKTFEEAERQNLEQIKQLEETLQHEREMKQKQQQYQEQLLHMIYEKDITAEQEKEILEKIKKENPDEVEELMLLKKERPIEFRKILIQRQYELERLEELKERDPGRYEQKIKEHSLERQSRQLTEKFRENNDEKEKARIKNDLSVVLSELFDLREKDREEEIKHLNQKLEHLKSVLAERKKKKKEIVDRRLQELIGERDVLIW
jgi:hypothetical protein